MFSFPPGHVYVSGGYVTFDNVAFFNEAEGMMDPGFLLVGGDVYMGDGTLEMNGCSMTNNYLLIDVVSAGTFSAIMGGVGILNGVSWVWNVGTIRARGAGKFFETLTRSQEKHAHNADEPQ